MFWNLFGSGVQIHTPAVRTTPVLLERTTQFRQVVYRIHFIAATCLKYA